FLIVLVIAEALLSWFSKSYTAAALRPVVRLLLRPLVDPIARRMPERQPWGLDFSPIIAFLILQVLVGFQASLEAAVLKALLGTA
ncbi:MAG: YggT family protein, partial [Burkholderiaceae bacterium]